MFLANILDIGVTLVLVMLLLHPLVSCVAVFFFSCQTFSLRLIFENNLAVSVNKSGATVLNLRPEADDRLTFELGNLFALLPRLDLRPRGGARLLTPKLNTVPTLKVTFSSADSFGCAF